MEEFAIVLKATYTNEDGDTLEFLFDDYQEFQRVFKMHDELIEAGFELEFENVYSTRNESEEMDEYQIWLAEYKDV